MQHSLSADHVGKSRPVEELALIFSYPPGAVLSDCLDLMLPTAALFVHVPWYILPYGVYLLF